ncbi:MAG: DUF4139 domain-containing protein [Polyangiaceae bacterium]|nr:DUF4139 domain-containing protein [Polyangiaceae bacterium]
MASEQTVETVVADVQNNISPSRATVVTFFEDRAEVVRCASIKPNQSSFWARIVGVSPFVDERTISAKIVDGKGQVNAARVKWSALQKTSLGRDELDRLESEHRAAERNVSNAETARDRGTHRVFQLNALYTKWAAEAARVAAGLRESEKLNAWHDAWAQLGSAANEAHNAITLATAKRAEAEEVKSRTALRLYQGRVLTPSFEASIEVDVTAQTPGDELEIEVTYRIPCAFWRPEHLVRLEPAAAQKSGEKGVGRTMELVSYATVWQAAGENWEGVHARFSTARPARDATPPLVRDDVLHLRRKTPEERTRVMVEAREQTREMTGIDRGTRAVDEMPGVDDGGEPLTFTAEEPLTIVSNGRPLRVPIGQRTLNTEVDLILYPEVSGAAHVRATATLKGGPLLAGPLRVARGASLIGRSKIAFVGGGEPFEIGFGPDDGVRARRHVEEQRDTTAIIGTQKIRRKIDVFLSNLSGESKSLTVTERVPVSEIEDVEITLLDTADFSAKDADGFIKSKIVLNPNETRRLSFSYEIRAGSNVVLPF